MTQTSQPVHVVAIITGKPGTGDLIEPFLKDLAAGTHGEEGCLLYSLQRGVENTDQFVTVEKWTDLDALGQHMQTAHIQKALASAGEYLAEPPVIIPALPVVAGDEAKSAY